jgi:Ca-activated chloride channel homolog
MTFLWPAMLWFLLAVPLLVVFYVRILRRRKQFAVRYGNFGLLHEASGQGPGLRRHLPALLFLIGITLLGVALGRPQMVLSLPKVEGTVILAFDISGSMSATDMTPTRMEVAKAVARDFVARQPVTVQMGIVAFSESGISVQPPTNNQAAILASLNRLEPQRGTSLASGISASLETIEKALGQTPEDSGDFDPKLLPIPTPVPEGTYAPAEIILLTDGENNLDPNPLEAARQAADRGVRIHTIGVGSPAGIDLEVEGFIVHTQLDEALLQQISELTGGNYYLAETEADLQAIYASIQPQLTTKPEKTEITSILAGISSLVLLAGGMLSLLWFGRVP